MKRYIHILFVIASLSLLPTTLLSATQQNDSSGKRPHKQDLWQANSVEAGESSGAAIYSYPIELPNGRNGFTPRLEISYNSQNKRSDGWTGHAWEILLPSISRINKHGVNKIYKQNDFTSSLGGELKPVSLTDQTHGSHGQKYDNGDFLDYTYNSDNSWTVRQKDGTTHIFGNKASSRTDNPNDAGEIFDWYITKSTDKNGNKIAYEYEKFDNKVYPKAIHYSGFGTDAGIFSVEFVRETRPDILTNYDTGFEVKSRYRIKEILIKIRGQLRKKYELKYTTTDSGKISLLESIQPTAYDENSNSLTLSPTKFSYNTNLSIVDWKPTTAEMLPDEAFFSDIADFDPNYPTNIVQKYFMDVNGDGFSDYIVYGQSYNGAFYSQKSSFSVNVKLKNKDGTYETYYNNSFKIQFEQVTAKPLSSIGRFVDVNGDSLLDVVFAYSERYYDFHKVFINEGDKWVESTTWSIPQQITFAKPAPTNNASHFEGYFSDVNGDGLSDIILYDQWSYGFSISVYTNNGKDTWIEDPGYKLTHNTNSAFSQHASATKLADLNGDGLPELLFSYKNEMGCISYESCNIKIYTNTGKGWTDSPFTWNTIPYFVDNPSFYGLSYYNNYLMDINADGLVDIVRHTQTILSGLTQINLIANISNGVDGWSRKGWNLQYQVQDNVRGDAIRFHDFDSNTTMDAAIGYRTVTHLPCDPNGYYCYKKIYQNDGVASDLLKQIRHSNGSITEISYKALAEYRDENDEPLNSAPINFQTVHKITTDDGYGNKSTTEYEYADAFYYYNDPLEREFAGFGSMTKYDPEKNYTINYYHQGNDTMASIGEYDDHISKRGKPYRVEKYDANGNLYATTINRWVSADLGNGRYFVSLAQSVQTERDPLNSSDKRSSATLFTYDQTAGNMTGEVKLGEVTATDSGTISDIGNDKIALAYTYAKPTSSAYLKNFLSQIEAKDSKGNLISHKRYYYDNLGLGSVSIGDLTKEEDWLDTKSQFIIAGRYLYFNNGLVKERFDALSHKTSFSYDSENLYPIKVINPAGYITEYSDYNYLNGSPGKTININKSIIQTTFDSLGRPLKIEMSENENPNNLVTTKSYEYKDSFPRYLKEISHFDNSNAIDSIKYFDGLDRIVQTRTEAEDNNQFSVIDYKYDERGNLKAKSLPYFSASINQTSPTTKQHLYLTFAYDPLGRLIAKTDSIGIESTTYSSWKVTKSDRLSNKKIYSYDAFGQLIEVEEFNNNQSIKTRYSYDPVGIKLGKSRLAKISDAKGNIKNIFYDSFGRRIKSEDFHSAQDTTFGINSFEYDDAGNLISELHPDETRTVYKYDDLNRVVYKAVLPAGFPICLTELPKCTCSQDWQLDCWSSSWNGSKQALDWVDGSGICVPYNPTNWLQTCPNENPECVCDNKADWRALASTYGNTANLMTCNPAITPETNNWGWWHIGCVPPETKIGPKCSCDTGWKLSCWSSWWNGYKEADYWPEGADVCAPFDYTTWEQTCPNETPKCQCDDLAIWTELESTYGTTADLMTCNPNISSTTKNWGWLLADSKARTTNKKIALTSYEYDERGDNNIGQLTTVSKDDDIFEFEYDTHGNLKEKIVTIDKAKISQIFEYAYNRSNALISKKYNNGDIIEDYKYNDAGLLESTLVRTSDGLISSVILSTDYNPTGSISTRKYKNGMTTTYSYDEQKLYRLINKQTIAPLMISTSQKKKTEGNNDPFISNFEEPTTDDDAAASDSSGAPSESLTPASVISCGLIIPNSTPPSQIVQDITYTFDAVGNILKIDDRAHLETAKLVNYEYDNLYRLTKAETISAVNPKNRYNKSYRYDELGNMTFKSDIGEMNYGEKPNSPYANPHAATMIDQAALLYDKNGNVIEDDMNIYRWDGESRLLEIVAKLERSYYDHDLQKNITLPANSLIKYSYDPNGIRIKKEDGNSISYYTSPDYITIINSKNNVLIKNIANITDATVEKVDDDFVTYFIASDHLGGSTVIIDEAYNLSQVVDYAPYGQTTFSNNYKEFDERKKFTGHEHDSESGLTYAKQRYYNPEIGRWLSVDPAIRVLGNANELEQMLLIKPQRLNGYSYVINNPINKIDPSGNFDFNPLSDLSSLLNPVNLALSALDLFSQSGEIVQTIPSTINSLSYSNTVPFEVEGVDCGDAGFAVSPGGASAWSKIGISNKNNDTNMKVHGYKESSSTFGVGVKYEDDIFRYNKTGAEINPISADIGIEPNALGLHFGISAQPGVGGIGGSATFGIAKMDEGKFGGSINLSGALGPKLGGQIDLYFDVNEFKEDISTVKSLFH
ncbi:MAG: RHS repeat-associated core domain-containing protein [Pseudomonadota bacterium]